MNEVTSKPTQKIKKIKFKFKKNHYDDDEHVVEDNLTEFFTRTSLINNIIDCDDYKSLLIFLTSMPNIKTNNADTELRSCELIFHFLENYVIKYKFVFNKLHFNALFNEFKQYVLKDISMMVYFTPLFNFDSNINKKQFGDVHIKKITPNEFRIIKEDMVGSDAPTPSQMYNLKYVLVTAIPSGGILTDGDNIVKARFTRFIEICLIFHTGYFYTSSYYRNYTIWTKYSSSICRMYSAIKNNTYRIKSYKIKQLTIFYEAISKIELDNTTLSFLLLSINRFRLAVSRTHVHEKIVDLNIALECLFSSPGDTSTKLRNRVCCLLTNDDDKREQYWKFVQKTYALRSDIVHGRNIKSFSIDGVQYDIDSISTQLENIVRMSIKKFLNLIVYYDGSQIRDKIHNDLDVGLINRAKLAKLIDKCGTV